MAEKEYIEREAAAEAICWGCCDYDPDNPSACEGCAERAAVLAIPVADVVEVVRCKNCKHWLKDVAGCTDFVGRCEWANYMVGANGYCVYGEAKRMERARVNDY